MRILEARCARVSASLAMSVARSPGFAAPETAGWGRGALLPFPRLSANGRRVLKCRNELRFGSRIGAARGGFPARGTFWVHIRRVALSSILVARRSPGKWNARVDMGRDAMCADPYRHRRECSRSSIHPGELCRRASSLFDRRHGCKPWWRMTDGPGPLAFRRRAYERGVPAVGRTFTSNGSNASTLARLTRFAPTALIALTSALVACSMVVTPPPGDSSTAERAALDSAPVEASDAGCGEPQRYDAVACATEDAVRAEVTRICSTAGQRAFAITLTACDPSAAGASWTCCGSDGGPCGSGTVTGSECRTSASWREQASAECAQTGQTVDSFGLLMSCGSTVGSQGATFRCCAP